ncbi:hypothetical protein B0H13DRAFT_2005089 [Mycena leptocephala]|nr:hypothetical protein B0H13DRAFT_2005089 [Mycena leptocephala]
MPYAFRILGCNEPLTYFIQDTADSDSTDETTDDTSSDTVDDSSDDNGTETTDDGIDTTKSLGGCINVNGAISVNAGAEGSFFGLFDKFANAQLFNKNFKIFTKCFGDQATGAATDNSTAVDDGTDATAVDDGTATDSTDDGTDTDSTDDTADDSSDTTDATDSTDDSSVDDTSDSATADDSTTDSSRKRTTRRFAAPSSLERRIALTCPLASSSKKLGVTKGTVKSSSIKSSTA